MKESAVTSHIRLCAASKDVMLLRNNSGGFYDHTGRFVRYGLGGFSDKDGMASSDYIGWTPVLVTWEMIGKVLPVFTAVEMKPEGWKFTQSDKRACNQKAFIDMVARAEGFSGFASSVDDFKRIIKHE